MIPTLLNKKHIPDSLPKGMQELVEKLKQSKDKQECLMNAYKELSRKYRGYRLKVVYRFFELFMSDLNRIWKKDGFLHCVTFNYLLMIVLVKSGFFNLKDISLKWSRYCYLTPHQYLQIRLDNDQAINIDLWGKAYGVDYGRYVQGFV